MADKTQIQRQAQNRPEQPQQADLRQMRTLTPQVDVYENNDALLLVADMPGVKAEELDIQLDNRTLVIEGKRSSPEVLYRRQFHLPDHIDREGISADCHDGVLKLTLPYRGEVKPRQIKVGGG